MPLATIAAETPDKPAYVMAASGRVVTFRELNDDSNRLAQLWYSRGLRYGDHVSFCLPNTPELLKVAWAAQRSGLYYTAVNYHFTAEEIAYILSDSDARAVVVDASLGAVVDELVAVMPAQVETSLIVGGPRDGYEDYASTVAAFPAEPLAEELEGAPMLYSSGTTGRPKGVKYPNPRQPFGDTIGRFAVTQMYGMGPDSIYLSPAPLYHAAPLNFNTSIHRAGGTTVVMERFDPLEFLEYVERYRVTHTQLVPTMFVRMLKLPEEQRRVYDLSSLQLAIHAAAPCPVPVKRAMIEWWGPIIFEYYASTEGAGGTFITSEEWLAHPGSVGRTRAGIIHIVDEEGHEPPVGESGVVWFERPEGGPGFEYYKDPAKTSRAFDEHGWVSVGDMGYLDDEGYLYLTDRRDFMIVSGGVNIYPQEAENVLINHPRVLDVAVFGIPNEEMGEEVKAVVQPLDWADAGADFERELLAYCREHLSHYKCPRSVDFEHELPRQPTGKLYKRLLRERYWTGHTSRIV